MDDIELVRSKTDIVDLINSYIPLKKAGRNFKANCPFHSEKTPSFIVSPELQIFRCFGCGEAGNIFSFLQKYEGMSFGEALRFLADKVGVKLRRYQPTDEEQKKDRLLSLNHLAVEFYHYLLNKHKIGKPALNYLLQRGISHESIKNFQIGYAPDSWESLQRFLTKKGYKATEMENAGLIIRGNRGFYDRFRGRVIFPLHDHRGNTVGFAGRIIKKGEQGAKYINIPETILYHKSDLLYGLYQNRMHIKQVKRCLAVEGELDMISSWQAGVKNVVAIKGSALTQGQVNLIKRYADTLALALDADSAGDEATRRGISIAERAGLIVTVIDLRKAGDNKDPDDIAQTNPTKWRQMTKTGLVIYDYYLSSALERYGSEGSVAKKKITDELLPIFDKVDNEVVKSHFLKKLSQAIDINEEVLLSQMKKLAGRLTTSKSPSLSKPVVKPKSQVELLEEYLFALILQHDNPCQQFDQSLIDQLQTDRIKKALVTIYRSCQKANKRLSIAQLVADMPEELEPTVSAAFLTVLHDLVKDSNKYLQEISKTKLTLERLALKREQSNIATSIRDMEKNGESEDKIAQLRKNFDRISSRLVKIVS